jgi:hypothetical protein
MRRSTSLSRRGALLIRGPLYSAKCGARFCGGSLKSDDALASPGLHPRPGHNILRGVARATQTLPAGQISKILSSPFVKNFSLLFPGKSLAYP